MKIVTFTAPTDGSAYHCSEPGDQSGRYVAADKAEELLQTVVDCLHQLCTDSDLDDKVTAPEKYRQLADQCRAALIGTPYAYLAGNDFLCRQREAEKTAIAKFAQGLLVYVEDGNVEEIHDCGFIAELRQAVTDGGLDID